MNKNLILSIMTLFCANTVIFPAQNTTTANATMVQPLTAEENKKYQDLVTKYKNNRLTEADKNEKNFNILVKKAMILARGYHRYWEPELEKMQKYGGPDILIPIGFTMTGLLGSAVIDYAGYKIQQMLAPRIRTITSPVAKAGAAISLLPWIQLLGEIPLAKIYNYFYRSKNRETEEEMNLIKNIVNFLFPDRDFTYYYRDFNYYL